MTYGSLPADMQIDHINGNRSDNRIANLRLAEPSENQQNYRGGYGVSGKTGAIWNSTRGLYESRIRVNGKQLFLGYFENAEDAHRAYLAAKQSLHPFQPTIRIDQQGGRRG